jgi:hypothetical protein
MTDSSKFRLAITVCIALCTCISSADEELRTTASKDGAFSVGGTLNVTGGFPFKARSSSSVSKNNRSHGMLTAAAVHVALKLPTLHGWEYGGRIGVKATVSSAKPTGVDYLDRTYAYALKDDVGRIEIGNRKSVANLMKITPDIIAAATAGIDGAWPAFMNVYTNAIKSSNFIGGPDLVVPEGGEFYGHHEKHMKISIYTPDTVFSKREGFQAGLSYGPDNANVGNRVGIPHNSDHDNRYKAKHILSAALSWKKILSPESLFRIGVFAERAKYIPNNNELNLGLKFHHYQAVIVGALYQYGKAQFIVSYGNHFKSGFAKGFNVKSSYLYSAGASYKFDNGILTSLTYLHTNKNKNTLDVISLGADKEVLPGLKPYVELNYARAHQRNTITTNPTYKIEQAVAKDSAAGLIVGLKFTF